MLGTDDYASSEESGIRPIESTIMKSQWDHVGSTDAGRNNKHTRDWVDDTDFKEETGVTTSIQSRTMFDENQQLTKVQSYVSSVSRKDKIRMDHEIKATSPSKVPTDKMGAYLYGCASKEVLSSDVDRGCMLSCIQGYRPEDVDACNHDVYVLENTVLRKVYSAPEKTKSESAYIYTTLTNSDDVSFRLKQIKTIPSSYKVFSTNENGSTATLLFEAIPLPDIATINKLRNASVTNLEEESAQEPCPPPPPSTNYGSFWAWFFIILIAILLIAGIVWFVTYYMKQQQQQLSKPSDVVLVERETITVPSSDEEIWNSPIQSTGPRRPYSY